MSSQRRRFGLPVSLVCGALLPLAFAPFDYWLLAPICLAGCFWAIEGAAPKSAFVRALMFGIVSFLGGTYWTFISVNEFGGAPLALSLAAMLGLVLILALFFAVASAAASRFLPASARLRRFAALPAVWVIAEWCRNWMFTGFGWLSVGYSQTDSWLMSFAPLLGLPGVSYAVALTAGAALMLAASQPRERVSGLSIIVAIWGAAWALDGWRWTQPKPELVNVAIVQGAVSQDQKWLPEQYVPTLEKYRSLSLQTSDRDLIVWPEVAVPNLFSSAREYLEGVQTEIAASGGTLITGVLLRSSAGVAQNAVVAMTTVPQFYVKRHLVPFGEYFPVPAFARNWLRLLDLPYSDLGTGRAEQTPLRVAGELVSVSICYEDVFGHELLSAFPESSLIVNVSNDAWFGRSIAAEQHLQIARMRAAEVGRYVIRATNTGVSAVVNPLGDVIETGPSFEAAVLSATVQGFTGATPYVRTGNVPVVVAAFIALAAAVVTARRRG
ncbi:MAG: apolipoprotein N-acyltransferase [Gammaproteobacteria bacterium]|jgi:apolipoprotein N-acyltransferase